MYRLLERWVRVLALVVPAHVREQWRAEWDAELWYGVVGRPDVLRWRGCAGLAFGLLRDALEMRFGVAPDLPAGGAGERMRSVVMDIGYSLRALRKTPGFTTVVAVTLALGVGGTVSVLGVINSLLLNPLPYPDADRLVILWQGRHGASVDKDWFSGGHFADILSQTDAFERLALVGGGWSTLTGRGPGMRLGWVRATSSYLQMLGARAAVGRTLDEQDDRAEATPVALLTYDLWQRVFGAEPDVVGQEIHLDSGTFEIAGVLSPDLLLDNEVMPTMQRSGTVDLVLSFPDSGQVLGDREAEIYNIVGKLRPGRTLLETQTELDLVAASIQELYEADPESRFFIRAIPLLDEVLGSVRPALALLLAAVGGVLFIACINVANLLLARTETRRRELTVRAALGAERRRLIRQLLTEGAVLATLGGTLGVGLAVGILRAVRWLGASSLPRVAEVRIDSRVLLFSVVITAATCVVFALMPALHGSRTNLVQALRSETGTGIGSGLLWPRLNLSSALVVAEIGMSLVLLSSGGLLARSFVALTRVDPGFQADGRLTFRLELSEADYPDRAGRASFYHRLSKRLAALPGVIAVGAASEIPFNGGVSWGPVDIDAYVPPQGPDHQIISDFRVVTESYFEAMGIPLIRGRLFDERDGLDEDNLAIIDEHFAATYFPDNDPVGMRLEGFGRTGSRIIGVVGSIKRERLDHDSRVTTYFHQDQIGRRGMYMAVATTGDPQALSAPVIRSVSELDPNVAVADVSSMTGRIARSLAERRFAMGLIQALGLVAYILATVGIYGLISYRVQQRTRELGLRMALGASSGRIRSLVLRYGLALACAGVVTGIVVALPSSHLIRSMLFGVAAADGWTYGAVAFWLALTTLTASYVPAWRASRLNPLEVIKSP